jgi:hypothetical protein
MFIIVNPRKVFGIANLAFLFFILLFPAGLNGQPLPKRVKYYQVDHGFPFGYDHLSLSSDHYYFFTASTESGCVLAKGQWEIRGDKLYMKGIDSSTVNLQARVELVKGDTTEWVTIKAYDYFGKPFRGLTLRPVRRGEEQLSEFDWPSPDSLNTIRLSKKEFSGFCLAYQANDALDSIPFYELNDIQQITFYISWPEAGALDQPIRIITLKDGSFTIRRDGLYENGTRIYKLSESD